MKLWVALARHNYLVHQLKIVQYNSEAQFGISESKKFNFLFTLYCPFDMFETINKFNIDHREYMYLENNIRCNSDIFLILGKVLNVCKTLKEHLVLVGWKIFVRYFTKYFLYLPITAELSRYEKNYKYRHLYVLV